MLTTTTSFCLVNSLHQSIFLRPHRSSFRCMRCCSRHSPSTSGPSSPCVRCPSSYCIAPHLDPSFPCRQTLCPPLLPLLCHSSSTLLTLYFTFGLGTRSPVFKPPLFTEYREFRVSPVFQFRVIPVREKLSRGRSYPARSLSPSLILQSLSASALAFSHPLDPLYSTFSPLRLNG
ncbi:hypothetical protein H4582DRAFT_1326149 [Lactarius indigo]|nr:hypothetical protein H4582DRAFT_1326149 [Lactarius indigo]